MWESLGGHAGKAQTMSHVAVQGSARWRAVKAAHCLMDLCGSGACMGHTMPLMFAREAPGSTACLPPDVVAACQLATHLGPAPYAGAGVGVGISCLCLLLSSPTARLHSKLLLRLLLLLRLRVRGGGGGGGGHRARLGHRQHAGHGSRAVGGGIAQRHEHPADAAYHLQRISMHFRAAWSGVSVCSCE